MTHATDDHLRRLPKVELHCHVEGAARASTIADLARKHSVTLPVADPADLFEFTSLNQFLSIYDVICASLRCTSGILVERPTSRTRSISVGFKPASLSVCSASVKVSSICSAIRRSKLSRVSVKRTLAR